MKFKVDYEKLLKYLEKNSIDMAKMHRESETSGDEVRLVEVDPVTGKQVPCTINKLFILGDNNGVQTHAVVNPHLNPEDVFAISHIVPPSNHTLSDFAWELDLPMDNKTTYVRIPLADRLIGIEEAEPYKRDGSGEGFKPLQKNPRPGVEEKEFPFVTMNKRGEERKRIWKVYINGVKVPDNLVYVYAAINGTELFVPINFLKIGDNFTNELACIMQDFDETGYNRTHAVLKDASFINIKAPKSIKKEHVTVYLNGFLVDKDKYELDKNVTFGVNVEFHDKITGICEVYTDETYVEQSGLKHVTEENLLIVYFDQNSPSLKESAVFPGNADFYVNGIRVSKRNVKQITYRHFLVNYAEYTNEVNSVNVILSDKFLSSHPFNEYVDEWMRYEKWLTDNDELKILSGKKDLSSLLVGEKFSHKMLEFLGENTYKIGKNEHLSPENRIMAFIEENPQNLKILLSYFGVREKNLEVDLKSSNPQGSIDELLTFTLDNDDKDGEGWNLSHNAESFEKDARKPEFYFGDKCILQNEIKAVSKWGADTVTIPKNELKDKVTKIRLYDHPAMNVGERYLRLNTSRIAANGLMQVTQDLWFALSQYVSAEDRLSLGKYDIGDLMVYQAVDESDENYKNYIKADVESSRQFVLIENRPENYSLRDGNDPGEPLVLQMKIPKGSAIKEGRIIYIANSRRSITTTIDLSTMDGRNKTERLYLNSVNEKGDLVPYPVGDFYHKLTIDGVVCVEDVDYTILCGEKIPELTYSMIAFMRPVPKDAKVELTSTGIKNRHLAGRRVHGSFYSAKVNKYGFIFLDNLEIPFSCDYMDLYLNGKKIRKEDIIVYSDKLIRVLKESVPFTSVAVITRFDRDYDWFAPYIAKYGEIKRQRPDFDEILKKYCIPEEITDPGAWYPQTPDINDIYEDAPNDVDNTDKTVPNPKKNVGGGGESNSSWYDPLVNRLAKDFNRYINKIPRSIDRENGVLFGYPEYVALMTKLQREKKEIFLDCKPTDMVLTEDWIIDQNELYRTYEQLSALLAKLLTHGHMEEIDSNKEVEKEYKSPLLEFFVYPDDPINLDCNVPMDDREGLTEDIIVDLNTLIK